VGAGPKHVHSEEGTEQVNDVGQTKQVMSPYSVQSMEQVLHVVEPLCGTHSTFLPF
jgi:hypothetical protein